MVERLKEAIEKARAARAVQPVAATAAAPPSGMSDNKWESLPLATLDTRHLQRQRIVTATKAHPAHLAFDLLRTRLLGATRQNGWRRIAITSPSAGCGKSFVSMNLAFSLGRGSGSRTVLLDLDLRAPSIGRTLGLWPERGMTDFIIGEAALEQTFMRLGQNLAVCINTRRPADSAELLMAQRSLDAVRSVDRLLAPDYVLYDLPPLFGCDDALAFLPNVDAVLLVAGAGVTTAAQISECERLLPEGLPLLGVVLNRAEDIDAEAYSGAYASAEAEGVKEPG